MFADRAAFAAGLFFLHVVFQSIYNKPAVV